MAILRVIGEDSDFDRVNSANLSVSSGVTASNKRSQARQYVDIYVVASANNLNSFAKLDLPSAITSCWVTARYNTSLSTTVSGLFPLGLAKAGVKRIGLMASGTPNKLAIGKISAAGVITTLATEAGTFILDVVYKYDMQVINFGTTGTVNVYRANADGTNSTLLMTFTGDLTTDGITNLDSVISQGINNSGLSYISEVIIATTDTRGMGLVTLEPTANGNTYAWSGSFTDVSESTLSDVTLISSTTDGQLAQFAFNSSRIGTPGYIEAVVVSARGQGGGGVTTFTPNIRIAAIDYFGTGIVPNAGLKPIQSVFATNPNTGAVFTFSQLTAVGVNYGFRANL